MVCAIKTIDSQLNPTDPGVLAKESSRTRSSQMSCGSHGRDGPLKLKHRTKRAWRTSGRFQVLCLQFMGVCYMVPIPRSLQVPVLHILHLGHFGMQRMKQLARTAVYWPRIDEDIANQCHRCSTCVEHQSRPPKQPNHPWMLPEKPWSRIHLDHAINFMGSNWLVIIDSYSKYPCIHTTTSVSSKATTDLLEQDFAHFGYLSSHHCHGQLFFISIFNRVPVMVPGKGNRPPDRRFLPSCYQQGSRTASADI